jgi:hypothetical protein
MKPFLTHINNFVRGFLLLMLAILELETSGILS